MSTMIDITKLSPAEIRAYAKQREAEDRAERARQRELDKQARVAAYDTNLAEMALAAIELGKVVTKFAKAATKEGRLAAMSVYQREFFEALNAFQGLSTAAGVNIACFYEEGMTDEERAAYDAKQAEKKARQAQRRAKASS